MAILQFCTISRYQPTQHPGCLGWSVYLPPPDIMLVHHFCGKYSVKTLYLYHPISAKHHSLLTLRGFHQWHLHGGFLDGWVHQRLLVWAQLPHQEKPKRVNPIETLGVSGSSTPKARWQVEQNKCSTKVITPVVNTSPGAQCKWN